MNQIQPVQPDNEAPKVQPSGGPGKIYGSPTKSLVLLVINRETRKLMPLPWDSEKGGIPVVLSIRN